MRRISSSNNVVVDTADDHDADEGLRKSRSRSRRLILIRYRVQLFLRYMIILSFLFSTIALTWFTTQNYKPHNNNSNNKHQEQEHDNDSNKTNVNANSNISNFDFNHSSHVVEGNGSDHVINANGNGDVSIEQSRHEMMKDGNEGNSSNNRSGGDDRGERGSGGGGGENNNTETKKKDDGKEEEQQQKYSNIDASTIIYIIGSCWWILTGTLIYLSPLLITMIDHVCCCCFWKSRKGIGDAGFHINDDGDNDEEEEEEEEDDTEQSSNSETVDFDFTDYPVVAVVNNNETTTASSSKRSIPFFRCFSSIKIKTWRLILFGLIIVPSLWVFSYGTYNGIPRRKLQMMSDNGDENNDQSASTTTLSVLDWIKILIMASAMPAGTAGMVSMGIYVFGTIGKHCPLWSSYIVMPTKPYNNKSNNSNDDDTHNNSSNNATANTNNLMHDALRLHQWAGYVSFVWIMIHSLCYTLIYGFFGIISDQEENQDQVPNHKWTYYVWIFIRSAYLAMIPPKECRPWYHIPDDEQNQNNSTNSTTTAATTATTTTTNGDDHHRLLQHGGHGSSCYGYSRNFYGLIGTLSFLLLVMTSLSTIRRKSYRFFYLSHIFYATIFVIATIMHMKRNILYILPSIILYLSTTIPTVIQQLLQSLPSFEYWLSFSSIFWCNDNYGGGGGGVQIDEYKLVLSSSSSSQPGDDNNNNADDDGMDCVELTFSVDERIIPKSISTSGSPSSYRPKSVKICVPSISLLWYPFTIIETEKSTGPVQFKILFKKVGYFTTTILNRLKHHKEQKQQQQEADQRRIRCIDNGNAGEYDIFVSGNGDDDREKHKQLHLPLILVDGFYAGTSDWIANALNHDVVLIAAGGIGVTPFLTLLPMLLKEFSSSLYDDSDDNRNDKLSTLNTVSFLWCCRDEALIKHVIRSYFLPLFHHNQNTILDREDGVGGVFTSNTNCVRFKLMIYNTSRNQNDKQPFVLFDDDDEDHNIVPACPNSSRSSSRRDIFRDEIISEEDSHNQENYGHDRTSIFTHTMASPQCADAGGYPMRPSKFYHDPFSSPSTAVIASISFVSVSILGMVLHRWLYLHYILENTHQFFIRPYGLYGILILSIVVGVVVDGFWRFWLFLSSSSTRRYKNGYTATEVNNELALSDEGVNDDNNNGITGGNFGIENTSFCGGNDETLRSLSPGEPHRKVIGTSSRGTKKVLLELGISNGRPLLFDEDYDDENNASEDSNNDSIDAHATSAEVEATPIMRNIIKAQRPGVFYCGPEGLLDTIKSGVHTNQQRFRDTEGDKANDDVANCVFYEESFEM